MKSSLSLCSTFLAHSLLLLLFLPSILKCDQDLIDKTCKKTPYYDLCVSSLQSNSQNINADIKGLASIMANITLHNATDMLNYLHKQINQTTDPELERRLTYCAESYSSVVNYILPQAIEELANGRYGFAKYGISDAREEANACKKKISGSVKSPLLAMNRVMQNLCHITVAIINILLKG